MRMHMKTRSTQLAHNLIFFLYEADSEQWVRMARVVTETQQEQDSACATVFEGRDPVGNFQSSVSSHMLDLVL